MGDDETSETEDEESQTDEEETEDDEEESKKMGEFEKIYINDREAAWYIYNNMERHLRFENIKRYKYKEFFEYHSTFKKILNQGDDFYVRKNKNFDEGQEVKWIETFQNI